MDCHNHAVIGGLSIRNSGTPNHVPTQAKLIVLFKVEICICVMGYNGMESTTLIAGW